MMLKGTSPPLYRCRPRLRLWSGWLLGLLTLVWVAPALAQGRPVSDDEVNAVAKQLYCPVCENEPLDVCGTQACQDWREEIRVQLSAGATPDQVMDDFAQRYGERVLAEPRFAGFGIALWLLPAIALVVGGWFFLRYLRSIQTPPTPAPAAPAATDEAYVQRIEQELKDV